MWNKQRSILLEKLPQPNKLLEKISKETQLVRMIDFEYLLTWDMKIVEETYVDPTSGETMTKKKIITKSKDGKEHIEEVVVDSKGNVKTVKYFIHKL